jgi:hypothetical protein
VFWALWPTERFVLNPHSSIFSKRGRLQILSFWNPHNMFHSRSLFNISKWNLFKKSERMMSLLLKIYDHIVSCSREFPLFNIKLFRPSTINQCNRVQLAIPLSSVRTGTDARHFPCLSQGHAEARQYPNTETWHIWKHPLAIFWTVSWRITECRAF